MADKIKDKISDDPQIKSEQHNLMILEFFKNQKTSFWNKNEVTHQAGGSISTDGGFSKSLTKTLNFNRVSKTIDYFYKKDMLIKFLDLEYSEQKQEKRNSIKEISSNSYRITTEGEKIYLKITSSCLEPEQKYLLGLK
ncbi:hypothetical protein OAI88_01585 [Nitrosopumilus sp.]|nr:hypothetical protein [Nitrosopumilus sp.]